MPTYMCQGRFSREAIRGMVASPEDRAEVISKLMQSVGGRLISYYMTFGEYDFMVLVEAPDESAMSAALITVAAGGGVTDLKATVAISSRDAMGAFRKAQDVANSFRSAGQPIWGDYPRHATTGRDQS